MINFDGQDWDGFDAYRQFNALRFHFAGTQVGEHGGGSYDYFKHGGSLSRFTREKYLQKGQDLQIKFEILAQQKTNQEIKEYYVSNFARGQQYIHDFTTKIWNEWKKYFQSYEYYFKNDVEKLLTDAENFDIIFICDKKGTHPKLVRMYLGGKITLESLVILESILRYRKRFDKEIDDPSKVWDRLSLLLRKYEPFVTERIDVSKCKQLLLEKARELEDE